MCVCSIQYTRSFLSNFNPAIDQSVYYYNDWAFQLEHNKVLKILSLYIWEYCTDYVLFITKVNTLEIKATMQN